MAQASTEDKPGQPAVKPVHLAVLVSSACIFASALLAAASVDSVMEVTHPITALGSVQAPETGPTLPANDEEYAAEIRKHTTSEKFLTPLVETIPASDSIPSPLEFLGYIPGSEGHLTYAADVHRYMKALAAVSPRIDVVAMGVTEEGRERLLVVASDEETLRNLARYKEITAQLADPRNTNPVEAETLIREGKAIYWATGGLHSPETGSPEMLMELAYRMAVEERPIFREIRDNVIFLITPVVEVDGRERIVDIMRYREALPNSSAPPLIYWGKYVAHDNNRDGIGLALSLSRQAIATAVDWHPQVMHDLHESVPFLYIMSGRGPFNSWLDPITTEEWVEMAWAEVRQMNEWNVPGVWTFDFFDGWAANYMIYATLGRNGIGRFYETFGNSVPDTMKREIGRQSRRNWFRMNPPTPTVMWSLRNNTNIMQSALIVGLHNVASHRARYLETFYHKGRRAIEKPYTDGPAAWLIPADGGRARLTARLINLLRKQTIEVHRTDEPFTVDVNNGLDDETESAEFGAGTYIVRMDQPYSRLADMLLDYQYYNPRDPAPYDDTGWTLGASFNVDTYRVTDPAMLEIPMRKVAEAGKTASVRGSGATWLIPATGEPELAQLRFRLPKLPMRAAEANFETVDRIFPAGSLVIDATLDDRLQDVATVLGLELVAVDAPPDVPMHELSTPRIAIVHNWSSTQSEGWYRYALDDLGIPFDYVSIQDVHAAANLTDRYEVILLTPGFGNVNLIIHGFPGEDPVPWETSELTPNLGVIDSSPDIRGGLGYKGLLHLQEFVRSGGLLIAVTNSANFAITTGLAPFVASDTPPSDLKARGALFASEVSDATSPIVYGYDDDIPVYFSGGPLLRVNAIGGGGFFGRGRNNDRGSGRRGRDAVPGHQPYIASEEEEEEEEVPYTDVDNITQMTRLRANHMIPPQESWPRIVLRFAETSDDLLISGMLGNGRSLTSRPAIVDIPVGEGNVVLFAINPMWRNQTFGQYGLLLNAIVHHDALNVGR